ncbi:cytidylyltransferase domain-containing protein [Clostridium botulinum]
MKKAACIIQARTGSTRLPGKVLKTLAGKPILSHIIDRLKQCDMLEDIIIATTNLEQDDAIVQLAKESDVLFFRGSEEDVLSRYVGASKLTKCDILVRITSDCPLIDPIIVDKTIAYYCDNNYDYVTPTCRNGIIRGLDTEVFTKEILYEIDKLSYGNSSCREHVTLYIYTHPKDYNIGKCLVDEKFDHNQWRLCIDQEEDYKLMGIIYNTLYEKGKIIDIYKVINFLENNIKLLSINADVVQKTV